MWPFRWSKNGIPTFAVENLVGAGTRVRGDLRGPGGFHVDGAVEGSIDAGGPVIVGVDGSVEGQIRGRDVIVLGHVRGDVSASGHLEIGPNGKVLGDITVQSFRMHKGGVFRGASCMASSEDARPALGTGFDNGLNLTIERPDIQRGRTLPPPNGAVPPPPPLAELGVMIASEPRLPAANDEDEAQSHQRLTAGGTQPGLGRVGFTKHG